MVGGTLEVDVEKKKNEIFIHIKLKRNEMFKISKGKTFQSVSVYSKPQICLGYSSKTEDSNHILLLDYDNTLKDVVFDDIRHIQKLFHLPPAYLLTTKEKRENGTIIGNYHVVILSKHTPKEVFEIMGHLDIDENFRTSPLRKISKSWVLRVGEKKGSGKPKFLEIMGDENLDREISSAHKKLLSNFFPKIKHPRYLNQDNLEEIKLQKYETK